MKDDGKEKGEIKGAVGGMKKGEGETREGIFMGKEILTTNEIPTKYHSNNSLLLSPQFLRIEIHIT